MAEETKDVKEEVITEPSAVAEPKTEAAVTPPEGAKPEQTKPETTVKEEPKEQNVPYSRFKEVVDQRNEERNQKNDLSQRLEKIEFQIKDQEEKNRPNPVDKAVEKLIEGGMEEASARTLAEASFDVATTVVEEKVAPLKKSTAQAEIDTWVRDFASTHKDYLDLEPQMYEVYKSLDNSMKGLVASSKGGLELLYGHVKSLNLEKDLKAKYQEGLQDGYKGKQEKTSVSTETGSLSTSTGLPTAKEIDEMPMAEYIKKRDLILKNQDKIVLNK